MKIKVAIYKSTMSDLTILLAFSKLRADNDYVRISEYVEVEFPELERSDVVVAQVAVLDNQAEKIKAGYHDAIRRIENMKAELLSLPAPVQS